MDLRSGKRGVTTLPHLKQTSSSKSSPRHALNSTLATRLRLLMPPKLLSRGLTAYERTRYRGTITFASQIVTVIITKIIS